MDSKRKVRHLIIIPMEVEKRTTKKPDGGTVYK
jgi:hypothetical protein